MQMFDNSKHTKHIAGFSIRQILLNNTWICPMCNRDAIKVSTDYTCYCHACGQYLHTTIDTIEQTLALEFWRPKRK